MAPQTGPNNDRTWFSSQMNVPMVIRAQCEAITRHLLVEEKQSAAQVLHASCLVVLLYSDAGVALVAARSQP